MLDPHTDRAVTEVQQAYGRLVGMLTEQSLDFRPFVEGDRVMFHLQVAEADRGKVIVKGAVIPVHCACF